MLDSNKGAPLGIELPRPRVDALLASACQSPLVVVHACAGFGKTRAVANYLAHANYRAVWLTFTSLDNSPARFWENLTSTFGLHNATLAHKMKKLGFPDTRQAFDAFLSALTGDLYQDDRTVVFVFDDLNLIEETAVKAFLLDLINAQMENNCILLLTRQWPTFEREPLVRPQLIGVDELRFTAEEAEALFEAAGIAVRREEAATINTYVSGWPIALSLLVISMLRDGTKTADMASLSTTKHKLYSLFEREVFSQYTSPEQNLLIHLSELESFPRGLVQAVSGERERDLGQLMAGNIFIRYDATARRFYFHPLYLEFLREKLDYADPDEVRDTYMRAATWCRKNGHYYDAVNYYRKCGCCEEVWNTLLLFSAIRHPQAEAEFMIAQIVWLPREFRKKNPMTRILLGVLLVNNLCFKEAETVLEGVQTELERDRPGSTLLGECYAARGLVALWMEQGGFGEYLKNAASLLPEGSSRWRRDLRLVDLGPGINLQNARAGELKRSLAEYVEYAPYMLKVYHGGGQGLDKLCECEVKFLTDDVKNAAGPAYKALYEGHAMAQYDIVGNAIFMLLRIYTVLGEYQNILDTMEHAQRYRRDEAASGLGIWDIIWGWFYSELGQTKKVAGWVRNAVQFGFAPVSIDRSGLVRMRCLIADGQYHEALALQSQFEVLAKSKNAVISLLYIELYRAVTHNYLGNYGDAIDAFKAAYNYARGNKMVMPFIEYGHRTRSLLERVRNTKGHGIPAAWLDEVHARAGTFAKRYAYLSGRFRQEREQNQNFGLSRREVELLDNLSQGLTREEISKSMGLSINTVKSITKQVFAKLGAINSADAIRIAMVNKIF